LHVAAKAYLCLSEPGYFARLSTVSRRSLELQGGIMKALDAQAFIARPYARDAVRMRRWDDLAKEPGRTTPRLDHFLSVVNGVRRITA